MDELNKKLAEWTGKLKVVMEDTPTGKPEMWLIPPRPSQSYLNEGWIDFTESLDACFKWLVPKGYLEFGEDAMLATLTDWIQEVLVHGYPTAFRDSAERLCLAFEKLIDKGTG